MRAAEQDHPAGRGGPRDGDAEPIELGFLAIKRNAIDELSGGHVRQQRRRRQALGQQLRGYLGDPHSAFTAGASILGPDVADHPYLSGLEVQLLGNLLSDALKGRPVGGTDLLILRQVMDHIHAG